MFSISLSLLRHFDISKRKLVLSSTLSARLQNLENYNRTRYCYIQFDESTESTALISTKLKGNKYLVSLEWSSFTISCNLLLRSTICCVCSPFLLCNVANSSACFNRRASKSAFPLNPGVPPAASRRRVSFDIVSWIFSPRSVFELSNNLLSVIWTQRYKTVHKFLHKVDIW